MKSRRSKILFIVFLAIVVLMAGIAYCLFLHPFWANSGTQAEDGQSDYADQFHIEQYVSDHDEDGGYGVCTDVVAFACKGSG